MLPQLQSLMNPQESFDNDIESNIKHILRVMRECLALDVAFISEFVRGQRVFIEVDKLESIETCNLGDSDPLEESYCQRIVDESIENIIYDAQNHPVTGSLKITEKLNIGSYIGVPLKLSSGVVYGTFCGFRREKADDLGPRDVRFLTALSAVVGQLLETRIKKVNKQRSYRKRICDLIDKQRYEVHFQAIYRLDSDNEIIGFEALSRFHLNPYRPPNEVFRMADKANLGEKLELLMVAEALKVAKPIAEDFHINLNVSPEHIVSGRLEKTLADFNLSHVHIEVSEHAPIDDYQSFRDAFGPLKERGAKLVIDDIGSGYSSFQHIINLKADIIKLDRTLVKDIDKDRRKYLLAKALASFAEAIHIGIVAEGIETEQELKVLQSVGIYHLQGFLLARPVPLEKIVSAKM